MLEVQFCISTLSVLCFASSDHYSYVLSLLLQSLSLLLLLFVVVVVVVVVVSSIISSISSMLFTLYASYDQRPSLPAAPRGRVLQAARSAHIRTVSFQNFMFVLAA